WELRMNDLGVGHAWLLAAKMPSTHMRRSSTPMRGWLRLEEVLVTFGLVLDVTLECELLASYAYAWTSTPMRGKGKQRCYT
ncbi:hypothetical protein PIB30_090155, partial [Stylosanthes scabra]|nr:hypothetical protein [Stylosanthes scabra]